MAGLRDHYIHPKTGADTDAVLDEAITSLGNTRGMQWLGDSGVTIHLLISLIQQAQDRLPQAVAEARDQEYTWAEIADLLGVTRASAWQRYAGRTTQHRTPHPPD